MPIVSYRPIIKMRIKHYARATNHIIRSSTESAENAARYGIKGSVTSKDIKRVFPDMFNRWGVMTKPTQKKIFTDLQQMLGITFSEAKELSKKMSIDRFVKLVLEFNRKSRLSNIKSKK